MNLRDLSYLVALARCKHFGKAAEASFVSQPALSMQIKKLEKYLGVQLIERTNKQVLLTEIGKTIADQASMILQQVDEMRELAKLASDPFCGSLKMGIIPTLAPYLLPRIIPKITNAFPRLQLYLIEEQTMFLLDKLKAGKIDAAILSPFQQGEEFKNVHLFEEEFLLAIHDKHPLKHRKKVKQAELQGQELLLLEDGHCLRDQALAICDAVKAKETKGFSATSLETLRHMVAAGVGITLIPKLAYKANDGLLYLPFASPKPVRIVSLIWRKSSPKEIVLSEMASQIRKIMA